jgi:hypothetical protein
MKICRRPSKNFRGLYPPPAMYRKSRLGKGLTASAACISDKLFVSAGKNQEKTWILANAFPFLHKLILSDALRNIIITN